MNLMPILLAGAGGAFGAVLRYLVSGIFPAYRDIPTGTLLGFWDEYHFKLASLRGRSGFRKIDRVKAIKYKEPNVRTSFSEDLIATCCKYWHSRAC